MQDAKGGGGRIRWKPDCLPAQDAVASHDPGRFIPQSVGEGTVKLSGAVALHYKNG